MFVRAHTDSHRVLFGRPSTRPPVGLKITSRLTEPAMCAGRPDHFDAHPTRIDHGKEAMTNLNDNNPIVRLGKSAVVFGVLSAILGVLVLIWPTVSIVVAAVFFGAYLLISGITQVIAAFGLPVSSTAGRVLMFISGAASLILAVLCFRDLSESALLLAIWIGVGFVFRGVAAIATGISDPGIPGRGWLIFSGVITILGGFVMLAYPFPSLQILALVAGVWLVVLGVTEVVAGIKVHKAAKHADF
jgi:uncharacterized membrane protein HdeD (DUF308 family)